MFENKNRVDRKGQFFLCCHNEESHAVLKKDCSRSCVAVPELWRHCDPCWALDAPTSPMFAYLGKKCVDECKPSSETIRDIRVVWLARTIVMVLIAFLILSFSPCELSTLDLLENDARMRVGVCGGILFALPQHVHNSVRAIEMQNMIEVTRSGSLLSLFSVRRSEELNWAVDGCLRWYHYVFWIGGSAVCQRNGDTDESFQS